MKKGGPAVSTVLISTVSRKKSPSHHDDYLLLSLRKKHDDQKSKDEAVSPSPDKDSKVASTSLAKQSVVADTGKEIEPQTRSNRKTYIIAGVIIAILLIAIVSIAVVYYVVLVDISSPDDTNDSKENRTKREILSMKLRKDFQQNLPNTAKPRFRKRNSSYQGSKSAQFYFLFEDHNSEN